MFTKSAVVAMEICIEWLENNGDVQFHCLGSVVVAWIDQQTIQDGTNFTIHSLHWWNYPTSTHRPL